MRTFKIAFICILLLSPACIRVTKKIRTSTIYHQTGGRGFPYLISDRKLGTISIGDGIDSTLTNLSTWFNVKNDSIPACEGGSEYSKIFRVFSREKNELLFSIEPGWGENDKSKVSRIITTSEIFKTDQGIQIGMTVRKLKSACEITGIDNSGETGVHITIKNFKGSFGLELPETNDLIKYTPLSIPGSLRIREIIIT
jgi:hypothetical protein